MQKNCFSMSLYRASGEMRKHFVIVTGVPFVNKLSYIKER